MANTSAVAEALGRTGYFWYDPAGHCIRRQNPNGTLAYFGYDEVGRIASLRNLKGDLSPICYFDYSYDPAGLVTGIAREGGVAIYYGYDAASRLTGETRQGPAGTLYAFAYGYDPAGNRAWKDIDGKLTYYTYDSAERLVHEVMDAKYTYYSYDKNGSCTRIEAPDEGKYTYFQYNDARLLKAAHVLPDARWNYFHYDGQLTRYCIEDSLGCQYYYWDGLKLLQRDNLTTGTARAFTHGHAPVPGIANMVEYAEGDESYDYHYDVRGTVHGITDADQDVAQAYEHDAWGVKLAEAGALENPIQYQACAWMQGAVPTFAAASPSRFYSASLGRFCERDLRRLAALNGYAYSRGDPVGHVDVQGLQGTLIPAKKDRWQLLCTGAPQTSQGSCPDGWRLYSTEVRGYGKTCGVGWANRKKALARQYPQRLLKDVFDVRFCSTTAGPKPTGEFCYRTLETSKGFGEAYSRYVSRDWYLFQLAQLHSPLTTWAEGQWRRDWVSLYHAIDEWDIVAQVEANCCDIWAFPHNRRWWVYLNTREIVSGIRDIKGTYQDVIPVHIGISGDPDDPPPGGVLDPTRPWPPAAPMPPRLPALPGPQWPELVPL